MAQTTDKAQNLLALISKGLHRHAEQSTAATLGDRSQYIGLSDIGRTLECPRAALAGKVLPRSHPDLSKLLTLQRGHWLEHGIGQALSAHGLHMLPQLELSIVHENVPIKAHLDFVLVWEKPRPAVRILELKSTEHLPDTLYTSYEVQLHGQAGLLAYYWNHPVFSLRDAAGSIQHANLTMPELCKAHFGLHLPKSANKVDLEAWVLCMSMSDAKAFGPYTPNASMRELCLNTAKTLWENKVALESGTITLDHMAYASGFHALCGYCDWNSQCPKYHDGEHQPEWEADLQQLEALKNSREVLDAQIITLETSIKEAYALSGMTGDWINTGSHRFKVSQQNGRRTLNRDALRLEITDAVGDENVAEKIISWCEVEGKPFQRLTINKIN